MSRFEGGRRQLAVERCLRRIVDEYPGVSEELRIEFLLAGVVLNLAVWFSAHILFRSVGKMDAGVIHTIAPDPASLEPLALLLSVAALVVMLRYEVGMLIVLGAAGVIGAIGAVMSLAG